MPRARATLRIRLPEALLGRVAASAMAGGAEERRFGDLERAVHFHVFRFVPAGARDVRLLWDDVRLEVVASFTPPPPASRRPPGA